MVKGAIKKGRVVGCCCRVQRSDPGDGEVAGCREKGTEKGSGIKRAAK